MSIPTQNELYEPIFRLMQDGRVRGLIDVEDAMAVHFALTRDQRETLKASGTQRLLNNRCGWATWRLIQPGFLQRIDRGTYQITELGKIRGEDISPLRRHELFPASDSVSGIATTVDAAQPTSRNPEELIDDAYKATQAKLSEDLLIEIAQKSPQFFERLVLQLLIKMGYGGSRQEAGEAVGKSGDGGIDGIINEDRLGLDAIYLQAKRWEGSVGEGPIRDFKGALDAKGAQKGVFITTSSFTPAAIAAAKNSRSYKIVLIDGQRLADLMIEHDLGVSVAAVYQLKRIDSDFFADE